jgi:hypothetical protein
MQTDPQRLEKTIADAARPVGIAAEPEVDLAPHQLLVLYDGT